MAASKQASLVVDVEDGSKEAAILARKRARDRRAQRAARDRAKEEVNTLKSKIDQLQESLAAYEARSIHLQSRHEAEKAQLTQEVLELRRKEVSNNRLRAVREHVVPYGLCLDSAILGSWDPKRLLGISDGKATTSSFSPLGWRIQSEFPSQHLRLPLHVPPACTSDKIIHPFILQMRSLLHAGSDGNSNMAQSGISQRRLEVQRTICKVGVDIMSTYPEISTLSKKIACLYIIIVTLNWLILETKESFETLPSWLRPTKTQLEVPHPAWIDRVPWPHIRDCLTQDQGITFEEYAHAYTLTFEINWAYKDETVLLDQPSSQDNVSVYRLNPAFEQHIRDLNNWTVGSRYGQIFPQFRDAVARSRSQFGGNESSYPSPEMVSDGIDIPRLGRDHP